MCRAPPVIVVGMSLSVMVGVSEERLVCFDNEQFVQFAF